MRRASASIRGQASTPRNSKSGMHERYTTKFVLDPALNHHGKRKNSNRALPAYHNCEIPLRRCCWHHHVRFGSIHALVDCRQVIDDPEARTMAVWELQVPGTHFCAAATSSCA